MSEQLERDLALAEAACQQHRSALVGLLKAKNQELVQANQALTDELEAARKTHRQEMADFEASVLDRMQALEQSVVRVQDECEKMTEDQYRARLEELTSFIRAQLKAHENQSERFRRQLERARLDYEADLERLAGLLEAAQVQRDEMVEALEQVRREHENTLQGRPASAQPIACLNCQELQERLQQLMCENDKLAGFNDRLVEQLETIQK